MSASPSAAAAAKPAPKRLGFVLFLLALIAVVFNRQIAPSVHYDWLNLIPLAAVIYIGYCLVAMDKTLGSVGWVQRALQPKPAKRPPLSFLVSPWLRSFVLIPLFFVGAEFGLRCVSYHRALFYERHGDLLFTPKPNQEYVEKISLTPSEINDLGLRGGPVDLAAQQQKRLILALGDSVVYGYGVDDQHTYPAALQHALDTKYPNRFTVLNGGVDAYPVALMDRKFLYLWDKGVHPDIAIIGYSFNEGWISQLVEGDEQNKALFAKRVSQKNMLRSFALYNVIVENWARAYYDKLKAKMVPGTNFMLPRDKYVEVYDKSLDKLVADLRSHNVAPVFLVFCGFDGQTGQYDTLGPFQKRFAAYAGSNGIPLLRSEDMLRGDLPADANMKPFFIDHAHMTPLGTEKVARHIADFLGGAPSENASPAAAKLSSASGQ